jgi:molybdopterin molybdotransferase
MEIAIQITGQPITVGARSRETCSGEAGALAEFFGIVRDRENGQPISALEYEAYTPMAENEMRRILQTLAEKHPCLAAQVVHRVGVIPVGETAIYLGVTAKHRGEAFAVITEFMNRLKQDVPIWKARALPVAEPGHAAGKSPPTPQKMELPHVVAHKTLDEARADIAGHCQPLPGVRAALAAAAGHVLREAVCAREDFPDADRSTRDGYAVLADDPSETFSIVDTLHAVDSRPRRLKTGEAVRVATGATLPCENLRVVMQEHGERTGDQFKILRRESALNLRRRGEEMRAGETVLPAGTKLDAGTLALLATVGCGQPLVSPRLNVFHFTTGDEIVPPDQKPRPGQIRDCNSILIRTLLQKIPCELAQQHLPEDFALAQSAIGHQLPAVRAADVVLVSGGASVGEKDFTRPLLEWLGFEIVFNRTNIRPGAPLIFGVSDGANTAANQGRRVAFGLPGNPLSHFVCFHLFVATALARLSGAEAPEFLTGTLTTKLEDKPNPRETLWPARWETQNGRVEITPLNWRSSGDVTALVKTNALIRVAANQNAPSAGMSVKFLPTAS